MQQYSISAFKTALEQNPRMERATALFIYNPNATNLKDETFIDFIDDFCKNIFLNKINFNRAKIVNPSYLEVVKLFDYKHSQENHIIILENGKISNIIVIDDLYQQYIMEMKKIEEFNN